MLLKRCRLAAEEAPPERVALVPHIDHADVGKFMVGQGVEALAGRESLQRQRQGRDIDQHHVAWRAQCRGGSVIGEILEQDGRPVPRPPAQFAFVEGERVFERARQIRRQIVCIGSRSEERQIARSSVDRRKTEASLGTLSGTGRLRRIGLVLRLGPGSGGGGSAGGGGTASGCSTWVVCWLE